MDLKEKYFEIAHKVVSFIGQKKFFDYLKIAEKPQKKFKLLDGVMNMVITIIILNFILEVIPATIASASIILSNYLTVNTIPGINEMIFVFGVNLIGGIILVIVLGIYSLLEFLVAKILGGTGSLEEHIKISYGSYLTMYILALPAIIISAIFGILGSIPLLNIIVCLLFLPLMVLGIIQLIIGIYGLYIKYVMVMELHKFDKLKTIITMFAPYLLLFIIGGIIMAVLLFLGISFASLGLAGLN